jgi:hypothetical protein
VCVWAVIECVSGEDGDEPCEQLGEVHDMINASAIGRCMHACMHVLSCMATGEQHKRTLICRHRLFGGAWRPGGKGGRPEREGTSRRENTHN